MTPTRWCAAAAVTALSSLTPLIGACSVAEGSHAEHALAGYSHRTHVHNTPLVAPPPAPPAPAAVPVDAPAGPGLPVGLGPTDYTVQPQPAPGSCHVRWTPDHQPLPDPHCTPGATNPKVTPATLRSTICRTGYTKSIRPPEQITGAEKRASMRAYGETSSRNTEYDHLVPLEVGGDPNDPRNLWPDPPSPGQQGINNPKDVVEEQLHDLVCSGAVPLAAAQTAIATNWTTALATVGHPNGR